MQASLESKLPLNTGRAMSVTWTYHLNNSLTRVAAVVALATVIVIWNLFTASSTPSRRGQGRSSQVYLQSLT